MFLPNLPAKFFVETRKNLCRRLPSRSLVVFNSNDVPPTNSDGSAQFYQNSDLFYLTGVRQEETVLMLFPDAPDPALREVLFLRETTPFLETWEGKKLSKDAARALTGIKTVKWLGELPAVLRAHMCEAENVFLNTNEHKRADPVVESRDRRFLDELMRAYPLHNYKRLAPFMHEMRAVKSPEEIKLMQAACDLTEKAFRRVLTFVKPGVYESEIEAEFAHEFIRVRERFAYMPIVASGKNALGLHYIDNNAECRAGELILIDVGGTCGLYNADMTRTIPVGGKFTKRQRQIYDSVLRALRELSDALRPGLLWADWQKNAGEVLERELVKLGVLSTSEIKKQSPDAPAYKKYFMHGIGHPLGLDVHDVGYTTRPMQAGWVMTVEPGLYIPEEGIGVRLENNILIGKSGNVNLMQNIPIEADEIEALMQKKTGKR